VYAVVPKFFLRRALIQSAFDVDGLMWMVFVRYHTLISFLLFISGFITFVLNLNYYGNASYQIRDWVWSMITSLIFCYLGFAFIYIIYEGLFWFVMCSMCVIINDIAAYLVGISWGKTPLI
jgi:phosphatidate cytidylyltransferase